MKKLTDTMIYTVFSRIAVIFSLLVSTSVTASQQNYLERQQIIDAAEQYVYQKLNGDSKDNLLIEGVPMDARIIVPRCQQPYEISASDEALRQSNITVKASCESMNWYIYLVVKATEMESVVVFSSAVSPGTVLTEHNLEIMEMDKKRLRGTTFSNIGSIVGARIKRRSRSGQPVVPNQLCFVCKGDTILITANSNGLTIKANGVAQQDGNLGDTITVKNSRSKKVIHAEVVSTNQVSIRI
jgi:flagella basal body P-ring formation protein FlgA